MLVLTRRAGEALFVGENVKVTMVRVRGGQVRLAIEAPPEVRVRREELTAAHKAAGGRSSDRRERKVPPVLRAG